MSIVLVQTSISGEVKIPRIAEPVVRRTVRAACDRAGAPPGQLGWVVDVTFVDEQTIRYYNETYRGGDGPTDVLSFSVSAPEEEEQLRGFADPMDLALLGDVLICPEQIDEDRNELHQIAVLACHGTLHLLGWAHEDEEGAGEMDRVTEDVLTDVLPQPD